jgi:Na+-translocating ferredoxin:NAD+ oxidoreductase RnfD subunit
MIPILEPAQYPAILLNGVLITVVMGIPTALISLVIFIVLERLPFRWVRLLLPAAGAALMLLINLMYFSSGPKSPEDYQRTWVQMMAAGLLLDAFVILAPFPFIRKYIVARSPYIVIPFAVLATFFLLIAFGLMGGDAQRLPDTESGKLMMTVFFVVGEFVTAAIVYGCIALWETKVHRAENGK